jgi:hypothetical protein
MQTLLLDRTIWDLVLTSAGDIAAANDPYSVSQDVCSAIRTFQGECWYDTTLGVPYNLILGQFPPIEYVKAQLVQAALTVPEVTSAKCFLASLVGRLVTGQVQFTYQAPGAASVPQTGVVIFRGDNGRFSSWVGDNGAFAVWYGY